MLWEPSDSRGWLVQSFDDQENRRDLKYMEFIPCLQIIHVLYQSIVTLDFGSLLRCWWEWQRLLLASNHFVKMMLKYCQNTLENIGEDKRLDITQTCKMLLFEIPHGINVRPTTLGYRKDSRIGYRKIPNSAKIHGENLHTGHIQSMSPLLAGQCNKHLSIIALCQKCMIRQTSTRN